MSHQSSASRLFALILVGASSLACGGAPPPCSDCDAGAVITEDGGDPVHAPDATAAADAGSDAAAESSDAGPDLPPGASLDRLGLRVEGGEVSDEPMPTATTTGDEAVITSVTTTADEDSFVLEIDVDAYVETVSIHVAIDGLHVVVPVTTSEARVNVVPGWFPSSTTLRGCGAAVGGTETEGCYAPCLDACRSPDACAVPPSTEEYLFGSCIEQCSVMSAFLDDCARFGGDCAGVDPDEDWVPHGQAAWARYGSVDAYISALRADRLSGGWLCDYKNSLDFDRLAGVSEIRFYGALSCIEYEHTTGLETYWTCAAGISVPPGSGRIVTQDRIRVRFVPQDWTRVVANAGLQPIDVAVESRAAGGAATVSNLARATLDVCTSRGVLPGCG